VSKSSTKIITALLLSTILPGTAMAQVPSAPTRPGLVLQQPVGQQQFPQAPAQPSTQLVQRTYDGTNGQTSAPAPYAQPAPPQELFYVDENSGGPDALAGGLSDYNTDRMNQTGQQLRGNYGPIGQSSSMPSGMVQDAWNRPFDNMSQGQIAPGSIRYQWSSDLVMPVRLRAGMVTSVVLPEWEAAQDVVVGDGSAIEASIIRANQVLVKSVQTGLDTTLSVIGGSGNVYTFYLRTEGRNTTVLTDLQVFVQAAPSKGSGEWFNGEVRNAYSSTETVRDMTPGRSGDTTISLPSAARQGDEAVPVDRRIFNLKMFEVNEGDRIIAPEYAYTDGRFTYLNFAAGVTDRPSVFRIVDGVEGRVNTRVTGAHSEVIIVEAIGDLILRSGTRSVCIKVVDRQDQVASRN
jgi:ComB9 competence protein